MPTTNKRINMAVPDELYERIKIYKAKNGITSDAGACLQLVTRQLDGIEHTEKLMQFASRFSLEELQGLSNIGMTQLKAMTEAHKENN